MNPSRSAFRSSLSFAIAFATRVYSTIAPLSTSMEPPASTEAFLPINADDSIEGFPQSSAKLYALMMSAEVLSEPPTADVALNCQSSRSELDRTATSFELTSFTPSAIDTAAFIVGFEPRKKFSPV